MLPTVISEPAELVMKLADLAQIIMSASPRVSVTLRELYNCLDFKGNLNRHLAIPEGHEETAYHLQRPSPLTGEEEIRGDLLVFDFVDHKNWMTITEFATLEEVERFILGNDGIFNSFTTSIVVIHHSHRLSYQVSFVEADGSRVVFDRRQHLDPVRVYQEPRIEWLNGDQLTA